MLLYALIGVAILVVAVIVYILVSDRLPSPTKPKKVEPEKGADEVPRYDVYVMSSGEKLFWTIAAAAVLFALGYFIYRKVILALLLTPFALKYPKMKARDLLTKKKSRLRIQFKDMLYSLSSALSAGKSIELAFKDIQKDLALLYPGRTGYIVHELERINIKFGMNEPVEEVMLDFATRTDIEEIVTFADILAASKRTGGNLIEIIKNTSKTISEKLEFRMELDVLLAERKFEQKVMGLFPFLIILVLSAMAPDYMEPVFNTFLGNLVMTCILVVFVIAWQIGAKIVDIEV